VGGVRGAGAVDNPSGTGPVRPSVPSVDVPGFELLAMASFADGVESWQARERTSGSACCLLVVAGAAEGAAEPLLRLRHDHLVPAVALLPLDAALAIRVVAHDGPDLARLRDVRGSLSPGEVVTLGVPLAQALGAAHAAGLVHGALHPADVLLDPAGRPILRGVGIAALAGRPAAPADDVVALARLLSSCLGDTVSPAANLVRGCLAPALVGHPAGRPTARALAAALGATCPPTPLRLPTGSTTGLPGGSTTGLPGGSTTGLAAGSTTGLAAGSTTRVPTRGGGAGPGTTSRPASAHRRPSPGSRPGGWRRRGGGPGLAGARTTIRRVLARVVGALALLWPPRARTVISAGVGLALAVTVLVIPVVRGPAPVAGLPPPLGAAPQLVDSTGVAAPMSPPRAAPAPPGPTAPAAPTTPTAAAAPAAPQAASAPARPPAPALPAGGWPAVLRALAAARAAAFATGDVDALAAADAHGSTAAAVDRARLQVWADAGAHLSGGPAEILATTVVSAGTRAAVLDTRERLPASVVRDRLGRELQRRPASAPADYRVTLVRTAQGWRTAEVTAR